MRSRLRQTNCGFRQLAPGNACCSLRRAARSWSLILSSGFASGSRNCGLSKRPVNHEVAIESERIDLAHQDPADRFLAATAVVFDLTLVTADDRLLKSKSFAVMPNR